MEPACPARRKRLRFRQETQISASRHPDRLRCPHRCRAREHLEGHAALAILIAVLCDEPTFWRDWQSIRSAIAAIDQVTDDATAQRLTHPAWTLSSSYGVQRPRHRRLISVILLAAARELNQAHGQERPPAAGRASGFARRHATRLRPPRCHQARAGRADGRGIPCRTLRRSRLPPSAARALFPDPRQTQGARTVLKGNAAVGAEPGRGCAAFPGLGSDRRLCSVADYFEGRARPPRLGKAFGSSRGSIGHQPPPVASSAVWISAGLDVELLITARRRGCPPVATMSANGSFPTGSRASGRSAGRAHRSGYRRSSSHAAVRQLPRSAARAIRTTSTASDSARARSTRSRNSPPAAIHR